MSRVLHNNDDNTDPKAIAKPRLFSEIFRAKKKKEKNYAPKLLFTDLFVF